ncbi:MAG: hypothetical protein ABIV51_08990, partial [Saprospiraceae bacterium]
NCSDRNNVWIKWIHKMANKFKVIDQSAQIDDECIVASLASVIYGSSKIIDRPKPSFGRLFVIPDVAPWQFSTFIGLKIYCKK